MLVHQQNDTPQDRPRPLWLDILIELVILSSVYFAYRFSSGSIDAKASTAFANARDLIDLEKSLGIFVETDIQSIFLEHSSLTHLANILYTVCYYPAVIGFGLWAYWRHRAKYKFVRTAFLISAFLAFIVFALYPMAPPRFFDGSAGIEDLGFVDTIATHWHANESSTDQPFYNPYAAMPSLHQGWTLMVGIGVLWMARSRWAKVIGFGLPALMFVGITSTANHFILDAVGGAIVVGAAFGLTALLWKYVPRLRPHEADPIHAQPAKTSPLITEMSAPDMPNRSG